MSGLLERIRAREIVDAPCMAVDARTGDRCTRSDPHAADDMHRRGVRTWGSRNLPPRPRWQDQLAARELTGRSVL